MKGLEKIRKLENFEGMERGKLIRKGLAKRRNRAGSLGQTTLALIMGNKRTCDNNLDTHAFDSSTL